MGGEDAELGNPGEKLIVRLLERARQQLGPEAPIDLLLDRASHGLVFVDEVDKIRSFVGDRPNTSGIRAQEALLTLIENEAVALTLPSWAGGGVVEIDSSGLLFVAGGAFEGLYDAVYDRVTVGTDRGALQPVTVVHDGRVHEETPFKLRDWLRAEDLFDYGMSPQFLSRFDAVVLLRDLGVLYGAGDGVPQDLTAAHDWYLKAAEQGFGDAQFNLAVLYYNGQGVEMDMNRAARWFTRAAEQGDANAQINLGVMYFEGQGVERDPRAAHMWFTLAATLSEDEALRQDALNNAAFVELNLQPADLANALAQQKGGKLRGLAVTSEKRSKLAPEVPAIAEELPGYELIAWFALVAPAGTPPEIVARLHQLTAASLAKPEVASRFATLGTDVAPMNRR